MLHITNGDSTGNLLVRGPLQGDIIVWRDVLHEGPVPADLSLAELSRVRATFVHGGGWTESLDDTIEGFAARDRALAESLTQDEVVLWFEHDLYDQLQLLQLLDWFAGQRLERTRLSLVCREEYLGTLTPRTLAVRFPSRAPVTPEQLATARAAWRAFRAPDPTAITTLLEGDLHSLPFLGAALRRHLEQFPSTFNGLSRTEQQALHALEEGPLSMAALFARSQADDAPAVFLGDSTFAWILASLALGESPLLTFADGTPYALPVSAEEAEQFWLREVMLTATGRAVLRGEQDRIATLGINIWRGGVHLRSPDAIWRWDAPSATMRAERR